MIIYDGHTVIGITFTCRQGLEIQNVQEGVGRILMVLYGMYMQGCEFKHKSPWVHTLYS